MTDNWIKKSDWMSQQKFKENNLYGQSVFKTTKRKLKNLMIEICLTTEMLKNISKHNLDFR